MSVVRHLGRDGCLQGNLLLEHRQGFLATLTVEFRISSSPNLKPAQLRQVKHTGSTYRMVGTEIPNSNPYRRIGNRTRIRYGYAEVEVLGPPGVRLANRPSTARPPEATTNDGQTTVSHQDQWPDAGQERSHLGDGPGTSHRRGRLVPGMASSAQRGRIHGWAWITPHTGPAAWRSLGR